MEICNKVSFYIDTELYNGIIYRIYVDTADILTFIGLVRDVPLIELNVV